jgi:hypothetical protein
MKKIILLLIMYISFFNASHQAMAGSGGGAGFIRTDSPILSIQNRGNHEIAFALLGANESPCGAEFHLASASIITITMCNDPGKLRMHDGQAFRTYEVHQGRTYEIFWNNTRWDIRDVTSDRNN